MDTKTRMTKQGLRDLNFYGSRKKATEAGAADPLSTTEPGAPAAADPAVDPTTLVPHAAAVPATPAAI
jgi:hypothetical protein